MAIKGKQLMFVVESRNSWASGPRI